MFGSLFGSRQIRSNRVRAGVVAGALVVVGTLSACGGAPGTAATVEGSKITDREVSKTVEDYNSFVPAGGDKMTAPAALNELIKADLAEKAMARRNLSKTEFDKFYDEGVNPEAKKDENVDELARQFLKTPFVASKIGEQEVEREYSRAEVKVNPRYGRWGEGKLDPASGSLSVPSMPQGQ